MKEKLAVLAIDDEQVVLDSIGRHLRKENFNLYPVLSARDGLELIGCEAIDIVLTDLMMPGIDGLEMLKLIKQKNPRTPVIMITGYATINSALEATRLGAFDYIAKPFTKQELLSVMKRAADLVEATRNQATGSAEQLSDSGHIGGEGKSASPGEYGWKKLRDDGTVLLGVDQTFLERVGKVQNVFLPAVGDQLRQGGVYLRVFSSDMRSHTVLSPLSGTVVEVNDKIADEPLSICEQPSESCWLIRLKPSKFDLEIKDLGLQDES